MRRKLLLWTAAIGGLLVLALALLLGTAPGLRATLKLAEQWLPGRLVIESAEGRLIGPMHLRGVRFVSPEVELTLADLRLDWRPLALVTGTLELAELTAADVELRLPASERPAAEPARDLPALATDWEVRLEQGRVERLSIVTGAGTQYALDRIDANAELAGGIVTADVAVAEARGTLAAVGRIETRTRYRHRLVLDYQDPAGTAAVQVRSEGNLETLRLAVEAPAWDLSLNATIDDPLDELQWRAEGSGRVPGVERIAASGSGSLRDAILDLEVAAYGYNLRAEPLELAWDAERVTLRRGLVRIPGVAPRIDARGALELATEPRFEVSLDAILDPAHPALGGHVEAARTTLTLAGTAERARLEGNAAVTTAGGEWLLDFDADADPGGLDPLRLSARGAPGELELSGALSWSDGFAWNAEVGGRGLDPGVIWPDWPADLELAGRTAGRIDAAPEASLELERIAGTLRGYPLAGSAAGRWSADGFDSLLADLSIGENRIEAAGEWAGARRARARVRIVDLGQLLPGTAGSVEATVDLGDEAGGLAMQATGSGGGLAWDQFRVEELEFSANATALVTALGAAAVDLSGFTYGGARIDRIGLRASGPWEGLGLDVDLVAGDLGELTAGAIVDATGLARSGRIERLDWNSTEYGTWRLRQSANYRIEDGQVVLETLCLDHRPGLVCASARPGADGLEWALKVQSLPAELAQVPLSIAIDRPLRLSGAVSGEVEARLTAAGLARMSASIEAREMVLSLDFGAGWQALPLGEVRVLADGDWDGLEASASTDSELFAATVAATLKGRPGAEDATLDARLEARVPDLSVVGGFVRIPVTLGGSGQADLSLIGPASDPVLSGRFTLADAAFEAAEYGSRWRDGRLEAVLEGDGKLRLEGRIEAEQGAVEIQGRADYRSGEARLELKGEAVRVANTPELKLELSPDLKFSADRSGYRLKGTVDVVTAIIEEIEARQALAASPDVVVVDEARTEDAPEELPLTTDLRVRFRNPAALTGYGMDAELSGELRVVDAPGEPVLATGELRVGGSYQAYGQDLTIEEGRLIYAQTPLDNPSIRADAYRAVGEVKAGVRISGRAAEPQLSLYSSPPMPDNEILSYLILGRPSGGAGDLDGSAMVTNAALQLGLSQGNNVVGQVGSKLGFDHLSINVDDEFGGAAVSIGRYLSPRLYLSYSTGLVQAVDLLRFEYRLGRKWSIQSEIGLQTRATVSYELETGKPKEAASLELERK